MSITQIFQALADPTRREILRMLGEQDMTAGDIAAVFDVSAPTISHHLKVLKEAELVQTQRDAQKIIYSLNTSVTHEIIQEMMALFRVGKSPLGTASAHDTGLPDSEE